MFKEFVGSRLKLYAYKTAAPKVLPTGHIRPAKDSNPDRELS